MIADIVVILGFPLLAFGLLFIDIVAGLFGSFFGYDMVRDKDYSTPETSGTEDMA